MIDFRLTETDRAQLERTRAEAMICRRYARELDENEEEMIPDTLPEADDFYAQAGPVPSTGPEDTQGPVMMLLQTMGHYWGDYSVRLKRPMRGGLGHAALAAAGTEEQKRKWGDLLLSMAITEPGCGCDPSRVATTAELDETTNEWILNGEKIFVTTGIRAHGVVLWATIDKSAGRAGIKSFLVEKGTPGFEVPHKEKKLGIRADDTAAYVFKDCRIPRENLLGLDESSSVMARLGNHVCARDRVTPIEEQVARLAAVTPDDVAAAAARILSEDPVRCGVGARRTSRP